MKAKIIVKQTTAFQISGLLSILASISPRHKAEIDEVLTKIGELLNGEKEEA